MTFDRGIADLIRSRDKALLARDATTWTETFATLSAWSTSNSPSVSGGKFFGPTSGAFGVAVRSASFVNRLRYTARLDFKDGLASNRHIGIAVTTSTAATLGSPNMGASIGLFVDCSTAGARTVYVNALGSVVGGTQLPAGNRKYLMGLTWDEVMGLGFFIRAEDGSYESQGWLPNSMLGAYKPTSVALISSDNRGSSGSGFGPAGFRASEASIGDLTNLSGGQTVHSGGPDTVENFRVALPAGYDSRVSYPLVIHCHGGGGTPSESNIIGTDFVNAGFIVAGGLFAANGTGNSYGAPQTIDKVVELYRWIRDRFMIGPVFLTGMSMGGFTATRVVADGRIPNIAGVALDAAALDLRWLWDNKSTVLPPAIEANFKTAWGITSNDLSDYLDKTNGGDPMLYPASDFRQVPFWLASSPSDTTVDETMNSLAFAEKLSDAGSPVTTYAATGLHDDPSGWPTSTIISWMKALAWS